MKSFCRVARARVCAFGESRDEMFFVFSAVSWGTSEKLDLFLDLFGAGCSRIWRKGFVRASVCNDFAKRIQFGSSSTGTLNTVGSVLTHKHMQTQTNRL